jgi:MFS family permease
MSADPAVRAQSDRSILSERRIRWSLILLMLSVILNYVDRQILGIVAVPIKAELGLSDTQLGLLAGVAFSIFFAFMGLPLAWLADRRNRARIIAVCCAGWCLFTAGCGLANSFVHLFIARMGVGIGEAGCMPPAFSLISDFFPPKRRARAFATYQFGIPVGSAFGMLCGGWIASHIDWRAAFLIIGLSGLPLAIALWIFIKEPVRGTQDRVKAETPRFGIVVRKLVTTPSFWFLTLGHACSTVLLFGVMFWLPSMLQRSYGLSLVHVSLAMGGIVLTGGIIGLWAGANFADRLGPSNPRAYALLPAAGYLLAAPAYAIAIFAPNPYWAIPLFILPQALGLFGSPPVSTAMQSIVPAEMRATTTALYQFIINLTGAGLGTLMLGIMSDHMAARYGANALRYSILYGLGFYVLSAFCFFMASLFLKRDWISTDKAVS